MIEDGRNVISIYNNVTKQFREDMIGYKMGLAGSLEFAGAGNGTGFLSGGSKVLCLAG